ncbi:radical SAM/SPASM domain-containing protein [Patescibacteria group bacterium]
MKRIKKIIKNSFLYKPLKKGQSFLVSFEVKKNLQKAKKGENMEMPNTVVFEPTTKCNLDCQMCYQKSERSTDAKDLTLEEVKEIFLNLKNSNKKLKYVSLIGAEVFMRLDLMEIIEFLDNINLKVYLATNGTLINERNIDKLKSLKNVTGIGYSLDGLKDVHNKIRGRDYAFDKLINAIELTKDCFSLTVNSVVMNENMDKILEIGKFVKEIGVSNYALQFEMSSTFEEIEKSGKVLRVNKEDFAIEKKENTGYRFGKKKILDLLGNLRKIKGLNVVVQPSVFERHPGKYLQGNLRVSEKLFCKDINSLRVNAQAKVIFCPFIKKSFGNLLEQNFAEIWNGREIKDFRKKLLQINLAPVCKRCCRLGYLE